MGKADRRMHRALERLDSVYAAELVRYRTTLGDQRAVLDDEQRPPEVRRDVLTQLAAMHDAAAKLAQAAADRDGGPGWLARSGHDAAWLHRHLWSDHVEPFVGVGYDDLRASAPA